ncbi:MAG: DUF3365 domain-containing protein [Candidatus Methylomirabilia bacterium]
MRRVVIIAVAGSLMLSPGPAKASPEEVAAVLSQVIINIRAAVAKHFTKTDEVNNLWWLPNKLYRRVLSANAVLPAGLAGLGIHPTNGDVVDLRMVVEEPRNEKNEPADPVEERLLAEVLRTGEPVATSTPDYAYHARPIKSGEWCMRCHGEPKGDPDPFFPEFKKNGWKPDEVIGAAIARVKR